MSVVSADLELLPAAGSSNKAPQLLLRGARRRQARKALQSLQSVINADNREGARADKLGYEPLYVTGTSSSDSYQSVLDVMTRISDVLAMKG